MKRSVTIFPALLLMIIALRATAQVFPVQATVQLTPPYSLYMADYVESGTDRVALNIFLADIARPQLDIRLRLRIVGQGITLETKPDYRPAPLSIQGGVPLRLISTDLAGYFDINNLNFQGMSRRAYDQAGKLPEGVYQFCFEVLEYNRGAKVSNTACATAWLILNDPPLINLPRQDEKLRIQSPQNVLLQWTPRHTGSPNSAFTTTYDVAMVEVWPATRNPNDAILSSPPIFETTTNSTTLVYGPAETPLEPGRRYAFRVRARSITGVSELDLFKNNGYSEVFTFVYGDACDLPSGVSSSNLGTTRFSLAWEGMFNHTAYTVRYREAGTLNWFENDVTATPSDIFSLKPATTYEYQISSTCGLYESNYTPSATLTTKPLPEAEYVCGAPMQPFTLDPTQYPGSLKVGDVIRAGDFDVKLTMVSGANGTFSGDGVIEVPYFNKAKVKTSFTAITVNKDLNMVSGYMTVTGAAADVIPSGAIEATTKLDEALGVIDSALVGIEDNLPQQFDPNSFVADQLIEVPGGIGSVYTESDGGVVIVDKSGQEQKLPPGTSAAIASDDGQGYLVDKKGKVHKTTADVARKAGNRVVKLAMQFADHAKALFGFDSPQHDALKRDYEAVQNQAVAWKSVASGATDVVAAILQDAGDVDKRKITFEQRGERLQAQPFSGDRTTVIVRGQGDGVEEGVLAVYAPSDTAKVQVLGKLNVVSYNRISHSVVIVPVGDVRLPGNLNDRVIKDSLNTIYRDAVVDWKVAVADPLPFLLPETFDDGQTGLVSNYTADMKRVIAANGNPQDETFYLYLVRNPQAPTTRGYMPRGMKSGFIFVSANSDPASLIRTMAHELGHGAFRLHHTFAEPNFSLAEQSTDNLMDYGEGTRLYKYQWDKMRYPDIVVAMFEADDEGQSVDAPVVHCVNEATLVQSLGDVFLDPDGGAVKLKEGMKPYAFFAASEGELAGRLVAYKLNGKAHIYFLTVPDKTYSGLWGIDDGTKKGAEDLTVLGKGQREAAKQVVINGKCYYGKTKLNDCSCKDLPEQFAKNPNTGLAGNSIQQKSTVVDKTGEGIDLSSIAGLLAGKQAYSDSQLGDMQVSVAQVFLTSDKNPAGIHEVEKAVVAKGIIKIWLHKNLAGGWTVREGLSTARLNNIYRDKFRSGYTFDINQELASPGMDIKEVTTAVYIIADWLSKRIATLYVPEQWWNCNNTEAFGVQKGDEKYFNPPWFINIVKKILAPTAFVFDALVQQVIPFDHPGFSALKDLQNVSAVNLQFAMMVGVWDGLVGLVSALPDGIRLATINFTNDPAAQREAEAMGNLIDSNGGGALGVGKMIFNSIADQFDARKPCVFAHSVGQVGFDVIIAIFTAGSATTASRFASTIRTVVKTLDKLDVLGNTVGAVASGGLKVAFRGTAKILTVTVRGSVKLIEASVDNGKYVFKVFKAAGVAASEIDWNSLEWVRIVEMVGANGERIRTPVLMSPKEPLSNAIYRMKQILKDENGLEIKNESGALVEIENTVTKQTDVVLAKGVASKLSDKISDFPELAGKLKSFNDNNLAQKFLADFDDASDEILNLLNSNDRRLVEAWKAFKGKGLDVLAKNPNALKYLDDLKSTAKFGNDGITDFNQLKNKWDQLFPSTVNPDGTSKLVRHHAIEQQVLTKYPGVVSDVEMQSINNLRGIPKGINSEVHLSAIRKEWNDFYKTFDQSGTAPTKQQLLDKATDIDNKFGNLFDPPLR